MVPARFCLIVGRVPRAVGEGRHGHIIKARSGFCLGGCDGAIVARHLVFRFSTRESDVVTFWAAYEMTDEDVRVMKELRKQMVRMAMQS